MTMFDMHWRNSRTVRYSCSPKSTPTHSSAESPPIPATPAHPGAGAGRASVHLSAAVHAGWIKPPDGQRPLVVGRRLDRPAPEPDVARGHVIVAVGQYDAVGGPGGGVDSRERHRHVGLAG